MAAPLFEIVVKGESDDPDETVRAIRALLKRLGRNYGLRCVICKPINEKSPAANGAQDGSTAENGSRGKEMDAINTIKKKHIREPEFHTAKEVMGAVLFACREAGYDNQWTQAIAYLLAEARRLGLHLTTASEMVVR